MTKRKQFLDLSNILDVIETLNFLVQQYKKQYIKEVSVKPIKLNEILKGVKLYDNRKVN